MHITIFICSCSSVHLIAHEVEEKRVSGDILHRQLRLDYTGCTTSGLLSADTSSGYIRRINTALETAPIYNRPFISPLTLQNF